MAKTNKIVLLGEPVLCDMLREQLGNLTGCPDLVIQDEWQTRKWFAAHQPPLVLLCIDQEKTVTRDTLGAYLFTLQGSLNVINAAAGNVSRLILISAGSHVAYVPLTRLLALYRVTRHCNFTSMARRKPAESRNDFAKRCVRVLSLPEHVHVPKTKTNAKSSCGPLQGREMRHAVLPQPARSRQASRLTEKKVLEVPVARAQTSSTGKLRAKLPAPARQGTPHPVYPYPRPIRALLH